jgi:hypothetical protein
MRRFTALLTALVVLTLARSGVRAQQTAAPTPAPTVSGIVTRMLHVPASDRINLDDPEHPGQLAVPSEPQSLPPLSASTTAPRAPSTGMTIIASFDASITGDTNAAAIEATINTAVAMYGPIFNDPVTVNINFAESSMGLGASSTYFATSGYSAYLTALKGDASTPDDTTATALLPNSATNPVNGASTINVKTANWRAVGVTVNPPPGQPDGFIQLNTHITSPGSPGSTGTYNLLPVVLHEIDEVLGLGSSLKNIPAGTIFPEDLFRYDGSGARTFTATASQLAYFSIDSTTKLAQFDNQDDGGDFGDWQSNPLPPSTPAKVQDAFATPGANPALSVELTALDVIGYNRSGAAPTITTQPSSQTIPYTTAASLSVTATGGGDTYQWYHGLTGDATHPFGGATSTTFTPTLIASTNVWVRVTNGAGHADSNTALVTVSYSGTFVAQSTTVQAMHLNQIRDRNSAERTYLGMGAASYTNAIVVGHQINAVDFTDTQTAISQTWVTAGMGSPVFSHPASAGTVILLSTILELQTKENQVEVAK